MFVVNLRFGPISAIFTAARRNMSAKSSEFPDNTVACQMRSEADVLLRRAAAVCGSQGRVARSRQRFSFLLIHDVDELRLCLLLIVVSC